MSPIRQFEQKLRALATAERCIFSSSDLAGIVPESSQFSVLLSRATKAGILERLCRGIYFYPHADYSIGNILYHSAARLRADHLLYLSFESVLSDHGIISQIPMQWITLMTSGRGNVIDCGKYGQIEFIHTSQKPTELASQLSYDAQRRLWVASVAQAMRDMKAAHRPMDLIDKELLHESI